MRNLKFVSCRFFGPMSAGLSVEGDADQLTIRECIFAEASQGAGVKFSANSNLREVHLLNNTFYQLDRGVMFEGMPTTAGSSGLKLARNLFVDLKGQELVVAKDYDEAGFAGITQNWAGIAENWAVR